MIGNLLNIATTAPTSRATPTAINNPIAMNGKDARIIEPTNKVVATMKLNTAGINFNADLRNPHADEAKDITPAFIFSPLLKNWPTDFPNPITVLPTLLTLSP